MLIKERCTILDEVPSDNVSLKELCIINYNITPVVSSTKRVIENNPNTTFWLASKDFSKAYILLANQLGIKNIIPVPIKTDLIDTFFQNKENKYDVKEHILNFAPLESSKILIVDDNELNIKLLVEILSDLGIHITSCINPQSCLELIQKEKFDLFLLDILMPEMSGFELAEKIKQTRINSLTPIIFISAISGTENVLNGYNLGACSYIEKPFNPNIVKSQIYNILKSEESKKNIDKDKEQFVATLTHDLKSPINAEICALNFLLKQQPDKLKNIQNEMLSELLSSAKYMRLITDKILCHYKQKNDKITLNRENVSIRSLIVSSIEELKFLAGEKNLDICFYTDVVEDSVNVDVIEIRRVINNILSNAIEYSKENGVIDVYLDKDKEFYTCRIRDYGYGIDMSKKEDVFEEYITFSKQQKKTGFGLGLSICKKIINSHEGEISIESEVGKGTTIEFTLPV